MNLVHVLAENDNEEKFLHISIAFKTEFGTTGKVDQLIFFLNLTIWTVWIGKDNIEPHTHTHTYTNTHTHTQTHTNTHANTHTQTHTHTHTH